MKRWEFERAVLASDLAPPARHVLLVLAVIANWPGGVVPAKYSPSLTKLAEATGLSRRAVMNHLNAVEKTPEQDGWVHRSRPTVEKARSEKERTAYRLGVPARARHALEAREPGALPRAPDAPELGQEVPRARAPRALYQDHSNTSFQAAAPGPEQIVAEATGATPAEATAIIKRIRNERAPRNLVGFLRRMATDGDLAQHLTEHRAAVRLREVEAAWTEIKRGPECEHRMPGGAMPHPATGEAVCLSCRATERRTSRGVTA